MKTDPKAGDVFDHVEPREPKTKRKRVSDVLLAV